jgi:arginyl-tRNA synthetase
MKLLFQLWKTMNGWVYQGFDVTYKRLGVSFDKIYYESQTYLLGKELVENGVKSGVLYKKEDGSVWIDLTAEGLRPQTFASFGWYFSVYDTGPWYCFVES